MDEIELQTCSQIYCILNYFPKTYIDKLPGKLSNLIKQNSNPKYFIKIDITKPLEEQEISKETKDMLVVLKYNYWSNDDEKRNMIALLNENEEKYQKELKEKYNLDNLFKNKTAKAEITEDSVAMIEYKESIFIKIKNWLKRIF